MHCPYCGADEIRVADSRPEEENNAIRRRRECAACGKRFTTYETVDQIPILVVKKDGRRETFDPSKIRTSIMKACEKRSVSAEQLDTLVREIEKRIQNAMVKEVSTQQIGVMVMRELRAIDEVAYVRFASVYRQFKDIRSFMDELQSLLDQSEIDESVKIEQPQ